MQFQHNQFIVDLPETLEENPKRFWSYCRSKTTNIHRTHCHGGLSATNPNDMACIFNKYLELASSNNTGESFVVAEIAFKVAVMTFSVAKISCCVADITFTVPVITSSVVEITFVETEITC